MQQCQKQGLYCAQYNIGMLYEEGCGVQQNYEIAREWYKKAANNKVPGANEKIKELDKNH